jgi:hypothetical protein
MGDLNQTLQQLALQAQQQTGAARSRTLMQLWETLYRSGKLYRPPRDRLPGNYQDIYDKAVFRLMEYVLRRIDRYDPSRASVLTWVNMKLDRSFLRDVIIEWSQEQAHFQVPSLADLDTPDLLENLPTPPDDPFPSELIQQCLETDEGDRFKTACMKKYPWVNFQQIALLYHRDGYSLTAIADQFQIPYTSLVTFYQRRLEAFAPLIQQACQN